MKTLKPVQKYTASSNLKKKKKIIHFRDNLIKVIKFIINLIRVFLL